MQFYVLIYVCYVCEDERTEEQEWLRKDIPADRGE